MSENRLLKNRSFIVVPFTYKEQTDFDVFMRGNFVSFHKSEVEKEPLLNHISELYEKVNYYVKEPDYKEMEENSVALVKSAVYLFPTMLGFYVSELEFGESVAVEDMITALKDLVEYIEARDKVFETKWKTEAAFKQIGEDVIQAMSLFSEKQNVCFLFHSVAEKISEEQAYNLRHINKLGTLPPNDVSKKNETVEAQLQIDKVHDYHLSAKCMAMVLGLSKETIRESKESYIPKYQENYVNNSFLLFLLLHHERQIMVRCKNDMIEVLNSRKKGIQMLKSNILDCLSFYSFQTVSDDSITQLVYDRYKEVLKIPQMEETMSNLIFKLDDELEKKKEKKMNQLTFGIAVFGIVSIIGATMDIIAHLLNWFGPTQLP